MKSSIDGNNMSRRALPMNLTEECYDGRVVMGFRREGRSESRNLPTNFWRVGGFWSRVIYTNESAAITEVKFDSVRPSSFSARMILPECQQQRRILRREVTDR
jgi:hypothetical protein